MVEPIAQPRLDQPHRLDGGEFLLGLPLEVRIAEKQGELRAGRCQQVFGRHLRRALVPAMLAPGAQAFQQGRAETRFVGAALRCRDGVAVGVQEPVGGLEPGNGPFDAPGLAGKRRLSGPDFRHGSGGVADLPLETVAQPARKVQKRLGGNVMSALEQRRVAGPADLHAAEQIRFRAAEPVEPVRQEMERAEDLRIGTEADRGAAAVLYSSGVDKLGHRLPAGIALPPQRAIARDLDFERFRERVHHRAADAVQPARGCVCLAAELAARVQRREDDLQRTEMPELRMRIDRDTPPVVTHRQPVLGLERDLDEARMSRDRLVHRIVQDFGGEVVQRRLIGSPDIHAGTPAHRLQSFENLDVPGGIPISVPPAAGRGEQIVHAVFPSLPRTLWWLGESGQGRLRRWNALPAPRSDAGGSPRDRLRARDDAGSSAPAYAPPGTRAACPVRATLR